MNATSVVDPKGLRSTQRDETRDELRARLEVDDAQWQMGSAEGRRNLWRLLLRIGGPTALIDEEYDPNAMLMANRAGKRHVVKRFVWLVREHCPDQWNLMFLENQEQKQ